MEDYILTLYDENGNPIPIPAIQGVGIKEIRLKEEGEDADAYEIVLDDDRVFVFYVKQGKTPGLETIVQAVLDALPVWNGGNY